MADEPDLYECDCCGAMVPRDQIAFVIAYGIDTTACDTCRGIDEPLDSIAGARICPVFRHLTGSAG